MGNPFYNQNQNPAPMQNGPFANMANLMRQIQQFKANFQGDPKQKVQDLLNSGQMSQQQFNQFSQLAQQLQSLFNRWRF